MRIARLFPAAAAALVVVGLAACAAAPLGQSAAPGTARVELRIPVVSSSGNAARLLFDDAAWLDVKLSTGGLEAASRTVAVAPGASSAAADFSVDPAFAYAVSVTGWNAARSQILYTGSGSVALGASSATVYLSPYSASAWPVLDSASPAAALSLGARAHASYSVVLGGTPGLALPALAGLDYYVQNPDGSPVALRSVDSAARVLEASAVKDAGAPVLLTVRNSLGTSNPASSLSLSYGPYAYIVHDASNSADAAYARGLKAILEADAAGLGATSGSDAPWIVSLVDAASVPSSYTASWSGSQPSGTVVFTPASGLGAYPGAGATTAQQAKVRTLVSSADRVIAVGNGTKVLDEVSAFFSAWSLTGTSPSALGWGPSGVDPSGTKLTAAANAAWSGPYLVGSAVAAGGTITWNSTASNFVEAYQPGAIPPAGGYLLASDFAVADYYPVFSQGAFLQFGMAALPDTAEGKVFLRDAFAWFRDLSL